MTTILEAMRAAALIEFDNMVAEREREIRAAMLTAGCRKAEIEVHIADCRARLAEQRALIPGNVLIALMRHDIPLEAPANDCL